MECIWSQDRVRAGLQRQFELRRLWLIISLLLSLLSIEVLVLAWFGLLAYGPEVTRAEIKLEKFQKLKFWVHGENYIIQECSADLNNRFKKTNVLAQKVNN